MNPQTINSSGFNVQKIGGASTIMQRLSEFLNWKTIAILVGVIIMSMLVYYIYSRYSSSKTAFTANREHETKDSNSNKTATLMLFYVDW